MTSCEFCGGLMEEGAVLCLACGSARRGGPGEPVRSREAEAHPPVVTGARCAVHPAAKAGFICARCGSFGCADCSTGSFQGYCARCSTQSLGTRATRAARFWASLLDSFCIGVFPLAAVILMLITTPRYGRAPGIGFIFALVGSVFAGGVAQLWAQLTWGQSLGKRALGIKVVRMNGEPIELWRLLLLRNLVMQVIAQACGLVGLVDALMIFGDEQRCLHDYLADSKVVNADEK